MTDAQEGAEPDTQEDVKRRIARLKVLNELTRFALPLAVASAGIAGIALTPVFPIAAAAVAVAVAASEAFVRRERKELDADMKKLREHGDIGPETDAKLSSEINRLTVGGPAN